MVHVGKDVQRGDSRSLIISNRSEEEGASLIVQLLKKTRLQCRRLWFNSWVGKTHWRKDRLPTPVFLGFPCRSSGKESSCNAGGPRLTPGLGRSPGEWKGYSLQYSGLENSMDSTVLLLLLLLSCFSHVRICVISVRFPHPWDSPGKNTGVDSLSILQGIFPTQGSNPGFLHCRWILYQLSHQGSPKILVWVAYHLSSTSSQSRN